MSASSAPRRSRASRPSALPECPVEQAILVVGGKWKLLVLRSLLLNGPQRYNELLASVSGISAKELTRNVRALTRSGLVAEPPGRGARYALTELGAALLPIFKRLLPWGRRLMAAR